MDQNLVVLKLETVRKLRIEASTFAQKIGANEYSDFILKYGRRPDAANAATIGRLIGHRVRASDGSIQPPISNIGRQVRKENAKHWYARREKMEHIGRLCAALHYLNDNNCDPALVLEQVGIFHGEVIVEKLEKSVLWLNRFAEEWNSHDKQSDRSTEYCGGCNAHSLSGGQR